MNGIELQVACRFELGEQLGGLTEGNGAVMARRARAAVNGYRSDGSVTIPGIDPPSKGNN